MAFFDKKADECTTDFDRWCYMFKHLGELTDAPEGFRDKVKCRLMSAARIANFNRKRRENYGNESGERAGSPVMELWREDAREVRHSATVMEPVKAELAR